MEEQKINKCGCGGMPEIYYHLTFANPDFMYIECPKCRCRTKLSTVKQKVIEIWNTAHPELSNAQQAVKWLEEGKAICSDKFEKNLYVQFLKDKGDVYLIEKSTNKPTQNRTQNMQTVTLFCVDDWKLYEEPLEVKVTKLPHEFEEGEEVLVRDSIFHRWNKRWFIWKEGKRYKTINEPSDTITSASATWLYCIPFINNKHLENKVTNCNSGAVPDGYDFPKKYKEVTYFEALKHFINNPESEVSHLVNCADKEENKTLEMFLCIEPCGNYTLEAIKDDFCHGTSPHRPELIKSYKWRIYE